MAVTGETAGTESNDGDALKKATRPAGRFYAI
jgi:hypothetical protein